MNFMDELLAEIEQAEEKRKLELNRLRADQLLMAIAKLEQRQDEVNELADNEVKLIEEYRQTEVTKVQKKISWLAWNLEQYIRSSDEKTIRLPHGHIKLRLGRDKVTIVELRRFLDDPTNQKFLKVVPESYEPDIKAIQDHIKTTGHIPDGADIKPAETKFSYTTLRSDKNGKEQQWTSEVRTSVESTNKITVAEE